VLNWLRLFFFGREGSRGVSGDGSPSDGNSDAFDPLCTSDPQGPIQQCSHAFLVRIQDPSLTAPIQQGKQALWVRVPSIPSNRGCSQTVRQSPRKRSGKPLCTSDVVSSFFDVLSLLMPNMGPGGSDSHSRRIIPLCTSDTQVSIQQGPQACRVRFPGSALRTRPFSSAHKHIAQW
jgi:hypothetical protein